jgi:hypothetical protein
MKKLYALLVCMFLFVVTCVAVQSVNFRWEKLDGDITGGLCYILQPENKCPNYTATCANSSCSQDYMADGTSYMSCDGSGSNMLNKAREGWTPGADASEPGNGITKITNTVVACVRVETCDTQCSYYPIAIAMKIDEGGQGQWLCVTNSVTHDHPVIHYSAAPDSTSCTNQ